MANVVEVSIRGIDEATKVFNSIESNADKAFSDIESSIEAIPDVDINAEVDSSRAEKEINDIEGAVSGAESAIKSIPDPQLDASKAENELKSVQQEAENTQKSIDDIDFEAVIGGLAAGGGIAGAVDKALDVSSLNTQIEIGFDIPQESIDAVKSSIKTVQSYGVDAEGALEGVRRQFALNADASDETNQKIIEGAGAIASAYGEVDFTELIQEVNEVGSELNITDEEALGLTNSLLQVGFPPGEIDIIAEYGKQLTDAGYEAEEIQGIMQAGVETGSWNIDILLDGLKEGRILISEFGAGVDDSMAEILEGTSISADQLEQWGQAVAGGGEEGKQAMSEVAQALAEVEDSTKQNELGVKFFGTMWEEQGTNILDTLQGAEDATFDLKEGTDAVSESVQTLDSSPAVTMKQAMQDINTALAPLYTGIANVVSQVAGWIQANPQLAGTIAAIVTVIGILVGIFMALSPIITTIVSAMGLLGVTFGAIATPILIVIGVIGALIAIIVLLWQNWDTVSQFLATSWEWIKETATTVFTAIGNAISVAWEWIKQTTITVWNAIKTFFSTLWQGIQTVFTVALNIIQTIITTVFNVIKTVITTIWNGIKTFFSNVWNGIVTVVTTAINIVQTIITTVFTTIQTIITTIWNTVKNVTSTVWNAIVSVVSTIINRLMNGIQNIFSTIRNIITTVWNAVKSISTSVWNGIKSSISSIISGISSTISRVFNTIKNTITNVWNSIKSATSRIWDGIVSVVKAPINTIIGFINGMIDALNGISIDIPQVPDWVPGIGGRGGGTIGFSIPNVPSLATGGVVSEPTLAMVGDAGAGNPEIVAPQKMIAQIVGAEIRKALQGLFSQYQPTNHTPQPLQIFLRIGRSQFVTLVEDITREQRRSEEQLEEYR
jgi:phage-related minor tail protein